MPIIAPILRAERRLMQKTIHKTRDKNHARRLTAILMLHWGDRVSEVARTLCCARSSVGRWINWFTRSQVLKVSPLYPQGADVSGRMNILCAAMPTDKTYAGRFWLSAFPLEYGTAGNKNQ